VSENAGLQRREIRYQGMVQGVGFRYTTRRIAAGFRVVGYVRNLSDGRVELVVEGDSAEIEQFLARVRHEMGHYIENVQETIGPAQNDYRRFEIQH